MRKALEGALEKPTLQPRAGLHARLCRVLPEPLVLLLYAVLIGIVGGYGAVLFRKLINVFNFAFFTSLRSGLHFLHRADVFVLPILGLILVSTIVKKFAPEAKGHGVPEVIAAIAENGSVIRPRVVLIKAFASALTIGSGGSVGREGPIVQIGSAFGSTLGQFLGLPEKYLRLMVACGAGAGIAATFNAPMGGVLFATEVILGSFALRNFTAIVISSVVSAAIGRIYLGNHPSFSKPIFHVGDFKLYWIYVILGILCGLWAFLYIRVLYSVEDRFDSLKWPFWAKAALGGAIIGFVGIWFPQIFGVGYSTVDDALKGHLHFGLLAALLLLKLLATSVTIAAGGSGGVFAPGLYQGAMLGGAMGVLVSVFFPHSGISAGAIATMAMAGVFAGSAQAPVTSIIMIFEMTDDYSLILPLMITSVLSATITSALSKETIYTLKLARRGLDITRRRDPDRMKAVSVGEAIARERMTLTSTMTVEEAWETFSVNHEWFAWVRSESGRLLGSVARAQVLEVLNSKQPHQTVETLLPATVHRVREQDTLARALDLMRKLNVTYLLVCRDDIPVGVIGSSDIIHAYRNIDA